MSMRFIALAVLGLLLLTPATVPAQPPAAAGEVPGKPFAALQQQIDELQRLLAEAVRENGALQRRIAALESGQQAQDDRLGDLERGQAAQDGRLRGLEGGQSTQDRRLARLEGDLAAQFTALQLLDSDLGLLAGRVDAVETGIGAGLVDGLADVLSVDGAGDIVISGANVYIQSGSGATNDDVGAGPCNPCVGKGNLIIGYDEDGGSPLPRTGSHNLVIGRLHSYTGFAGLVAGFSNTIGGDSATVTGGTFNNARDRGSVAGGTVNNATNGGAVGGGVACGANGTQWTAGRDPGRYIYQITGVSPSGGVTGQTLPLPHICF